ncbi:ComEC/Rec2 family competence protein [Flavobacterium sp. '19STA2R22 D10 B1']|uniref:ComEC/Rec2 family competence protein n=1 Tax=Flavobacterium aerium TaxID=3037261 RepID=UPI00278BB899|nr:ComEC/Rec2 family competence protein [Flavobacterium sp. '19STA2R22 D10 B1']
MKVLQFPLTRITVVFIAGVLFAFYYKLTMGNILPLFLLSCTLFYLAYLIYHRDFFQKIYFGLTASLFAFCIGCSTLILHTDHNNPKHYIHFIDLDNEKPIIEVSIYEQLKSNGNYQKYYAYIKSINQKRVTGKILLNVRKDSLNTIFSIGSNLLVNATIQKHKAPLNPNQFDYGAYLENNSISGQLYTTKDDIKTTTKIDKGISFYASKVRHRIISNLSHNGFDKEALSVVKALILGQKQDISPEVLRDYQSAGAVHILAVSGLHVGFLLLFLNFILKILPATPASQWIKLSIILITLWAFAILTGLSASVVRSVTMFSFIAVGMHLKRSIDMYHVLLVSMFFILLFKPHFLFDIGFQLSYTAVFSILWLQPTFSKFWKPQNIVLQYFRDILTVSFAAQIGTLPLTLYYFNQFSGLFFISNLFIIPLLSLLLPLGFVLSIMAVFNEVFDFLIYILEWSISLLNHIIHMIASYDQFVIQNIPFNTSMLVLSYLLIVVFVLWIKRPTFQRLSTGLIILILFQVLYIRIQWSQKSQQEWIVYNVTKKTLITERKGNNITVFYTDSIPPKGFHEMITQHYATASFATINNQKVLQNVAYFNNLKVLIMDQSGIYPPNVNPDVLLLTQSPSFNLERVLKKLSPQMVVADASNYRSSIALWKETCIKLKIPFHATAEKGFYSIKELN